MPSMVAPFFSTDVASLAFRLGPRVGQVFNGLLSLDISERSDCLHRISAYLLASDPINQRTLYRAASASSLSDDIDPTEASALVDCHILIALRMVRECPFPDVRDGLKTLLRKLQERGVDLPVPTWNSPSFFISKDDFPSYNDKDESVREILANTFVSMGRCPHIMRLLAFHPSFVARFQPLSDSVLRLQGPLPRTWRNYLGLMASACHDCQYLANLQLQEFLMNGGDPTWLRGLSYAPKKIQNLAHLNSVMAHQPWLITREMISALTKGEDSWSLSELVQAAVVLSTFHSLASLVLGCGIVPEIDHPGGSTPKDTPGPVDFDSNGPITSIPHENNELIQGTRALLDRLTKATDDGEEVDDEKADSSQTLATAVLFEQCEESGMHTGSHVPGSSTGTTPSATTSTRQRVVSSSHVGDAAHKLAAAIVSSSHADSEAPERPLNVVVQDFSLFLGPTQVQIAYSDFDVKSPLYSIFRLQDYCWEDHGWPLLAKYLPGVSDLLDQEFSETLNMTYHSLFDSDEVGMIKVDTWPLRQAIWYYILRLYGMCHDDFQYQNINKYLHRRLKSYIKRMVTRPEAIVPSDFLNMGMSLRPGEKVHIALLAVQAKKQAELLYFLHGVMVLGNK